MTQDLYGLPVTVQSEATLAMNLLTETPAETVICSSSRMRCRIALAIRVAVRSPSDISLTSRYASSKESGSMISVKSEKIARIAFDASRYLPIWGATTVSDGHRRMACAVGIAENEALAKKLAFDDLSQQLQASVNSQSLVSISKKGNKSSASLSQKIELTTESIPLNLVSIAEKSFKNKGIPICENLSFGFIID